MMNALKSAIISLALGLAFAGCSALLGHAPSGTSTVEDDIILSIGDATLAESLEKAKPLVDLNLEEE
jgi:hypothetical protein